MNYWLETPTCTAVRLDKNDKLHSIAPFGINDLLKMNIRPTPAGRRHALAKRIGKNARPNAKLLP